MSSPSDLVVFRRATAGVSRRSLRAFARVLRDEVAGGREFCCLITGDGELQRLNREFRGRDCPTDVLSFPADPLGDIAISAKRASQQALEHGHSVEQEIRILMLHGVLHLLGMDHESDRGRMRRAERKWRARLELPAGLIERVRP
jgi:probable rRNA maturation factor